ncbi:MAG TPA: ribosome silencing factor [Polyangiaceae bacterium]
MATKKITIKASHHAARPEPTRRKRKKPALPKPAPHVEPQPKPVPVRKARLENVPAESVASDEARRLATAIAAAALDKKAVGLEILDVAGRTDYADFLVLMSGRSDRQVAALAEGIEEAMRNNGRRVQNVEGRQGARWILLDFGDVVVHVFQEEVRSMYDLEGLFDDARRVPVPA